MSHKDKIQMFNALKFQNEQFESLSDLVGYTLCDITVNETNTEIRFHLTDDIYLQMYHVQECCEGVSIEDICGDINDLIGEEIKLAEVVSNYDNKQLSEHDDSYTWTFYKFRTHKGSVNIRWYGTSNGIAI